MLERIARYAEADVRLVRLLREDLDAAVPVRRSKRVGCAGLARGHVAQQLLEPLDETVADLATDPDNHPRRLVPPVEVLHERLARRAAYRLLAADDVPAERL